MHVYICIYIYITLCYMFYIDISNLLCILSKWYFVCVPRKYTWKHTCKNIGWKKWRFRLKWFCTLSMFFLLTTHWVCSAKTSGFANPELVWTASRLQAVHHQHIDPKCEANGSGFAYVIHKLPAPANNWFLGPLRISNPVSRVNGPCRCISMFASQNPSSPANCMIYNPLVILPTAFYHVPPSDQFYSISFVSFGFL